MYAINLNKDVFNGAARYAQKHNVSVESFIESLIINAVKEKPKFDYKSEENLSPLIKSLIGVLPQHNMIFSCPPYFDLEVYCDKPNDLSNMDYESFC